MVMLSCMYRARSRRVSCSVVIACFSMLIVSDRWMTVVATCSLPRAMFVSIC